MKSIKWNHIPTGKIYQSNRAGGLLPIDGSSNLALPIWLVENSLDWIKID